ILRLISNKTKKLLSCSGITLYLLSDDGKYLVIQETNVTHTQKRKIKELIKINIPRVKLPLVKGSYYYKALKKRKPVIINDDEEINKIISEFITVIPEKKKVSRRSIKKLIPAINKILNIKSVMIVPLISDGDEIGVIDSSGKSVFTDFDLERVKTISSQLAVAIKRKKIEEELTNAHTELNQIFDVSVDSIVAIDRDFNIIKMNKSSRDLFGINKKDAMGKKCYEVIKGEECHTKNCFLKRVLNGEKTINEKVERVNKHDKKITCDLVSKPIYSKEGRIKVIIEGYKDITLQEKAFEKIKEDENKFRELFNNMSSGVAVYEPVNGGSDFIIRDFNKAAEEIDNTKRKKVIGKSVLKAFPGIKEFGLYDIFKRVYKTGKPEKYPVRFYKDNRITGWRRNYVYKLPSGEIVAVYDDLTREKEAEKLLKDSEEFSSSLMENSPNQIVVFNSDFSIRYVNKAMENLIGIKSDKLTGKKPPYPWWPKKKIKEYREKFDEVFREGCIRKECRYVNKMGVGFWVEVYSKPVFSGRELEYVIMNWFDITDRKIIEKDLRRSYERLQRTLESVINTLASLVEKRDPYTSGHQKRVAKLSVAIARELGLSNETIESIRLAAIIHDIGKINIPASILTKPGKLTDIEFSLIKTHARTGYEMIKNIEFPMPIAKMILQHHEKMNGSGYPQGLKGEEIMLEARILTVADVVEAMSSDRPYRPALGIEVALEEIEKNKGKLYDSRAVDACVRVIAKRGFKFN
ncbi:MAG: PAS domain S-box protein, partial [Actinomycetota bacterium]|nr:PAS domain S-box protein [Actinomycetota bacterium]